MDVCNQEEHTTSIQPIAIGPCMLFKRYPKGRTRPARLWIRYLCTRKRSSSESRLIERGQWVDSFLTLYSDSTVCLREGTSERDHVLTSVRLVDVYRRLMFGESVLSMLMPDEVPTVDSKYLNSMLAVPSDQNCNSQMTWLFFFSQQTLNKWLVAFCKSIPPDKLNDANVSRACRHYLRHVERPEKESPPMALKKHIRLFFPLSARGGEKTAASTVCVNDRVKICEHPKQGRYGKKRPKRVQRGCRGSRKFK